jgi:hypothetical protein
MASALLGSRVMDDEDDLVPVNCGGCGNDRLRAVRRADRAGFPNREPLEWRVVRLMREAQSGERASDSCRHGR